MSNGRVAVLGVGQTPYRGSRPERSAPELVFEAVSEALEHAQVGQDEIDAVVFASAPEVFEGVHEPDRWCVEGYGGTGKEVIRVHTGGATGGSGALAGIQMVGSGRFDRVLVVGLERVGEAADAQQIFTTIFDPIYEQDVQLNVITTVALQCSRQLERFGLTREHMAWVSTKNFANGLLNEKSHLKRSITEAEVDESRMLAWPLRLLHCCPRSEGACAVVLGTEQVVGDRQVAWVRGASSAADLYRIGDRIYDDGWDYGEQRALSWATARAYAEAGIENPREEVDVVELYAPFSNVEVASYEALGFAPRGKGWQLVEEAATSRDGDIPFNPSGGPMTSNPIGATGLVRFAEAALQVMGEAGAHQIDGARTAVATATGGINQFFTVAVLDSQMN